MDNRRLFLLAALMVVAFLIYQAWMQDYGPKPPAGTAPAAAPAAASVPLPPLASSTTAPGAVVPAAAATPVAAAAGEDIRVRTDLFAAVINTAGGDLRRVELLKYPQALNQPQEPVAVLNSAPGQMLVTRSGLQTFSGPPAPGQDALYQASARDYRLDASQPRHLRVTLRWRGSQGLEVEKTYTFTRGSYQIGLTYEVHNTAASPWSGAAYLQFENHYVPENHSLFSLTRYDYQRVALHDAEGYRQFEFNDLVQAPLAASAADGWLAVVEHYFLAAVIPQPAAATHTYYSKALGGERFIVGAVTAPRTVAAGQSTTFTDTLFVGPKLQTLLPRVAPGLQLTVDYGKLTIIAEPLFKLLNLLHRLVGNWGWAILLLTVIVKLVFFPLNQVAGRSMAKMRRVQPRIKAIQERYQDDRQRLSQAMMELYKKEKINPMGGCLPMLIQIPIFFALYYVLVYSVELRQSPWILWIKDLSAPDPYYILPVLYGIVMFIQQHISPQPTTDKMQARIMKFLPLIFAVFYAVLPSGLTLYYVANSIFTIGQQWHINRVVAGDNRRHAEREANGGK